MDMDTQWVLARMRLLDLTQTDVARALQIDRSIVSRILNGHQLLRLDQIEPLASALQIPAIEIIERALDWHQSLRTATEPRADLLERAIKVALNILSPSYSPDAMSRTTTAVYKQLMESEAAGQPISNDARALRLIEETWRRALAQRSGNNNDSRGSG